jgi:hypothetical protein
MIHRMKMPKLERKDIISNGLSLIAIAVSLLVWKTSDTRASELRQKVIKYSVEPRGGSAGSGFGTDPNETTTATEDVGVEITNAGSLPVGSVTLSVSSITAGTAHLEADVQLKPAVDHEVVQQGNVFVIRLKNPIGPGEHVSASIGISDTFPSSDESTTNFRLNQAYVDSEVGAGVLIAGLDKDTKDRNH